VQEDQDRLNDAPDSPDAERTSTDPVRSRRPDAASSAPEASTDPVAERDRLKDQLLRVAADLENFRKRTRKDLEEADRRAKENVVRELLPVIDNLERAIAAASGAETVQGIIDGVGMVLKLFEDASNRIGLERLPSVGERFDPSIHDAIQQVETSEHPPGTIVSELVPGYRLGGKLIRAAMVAVARPPTDPS
jgi:molecular chaperone GrpE